MPAPFRRKPAYTTGDVARLLGLSVSCVNRLADTQGLPLRRIPAIGARRISHIDLCVWLANHPDLHPFLERLAAAQPAPERSLTPCP